MCFFSSDGLNQRKAVNKLKAGFVRHITGINVVLEIMNYCPSNVMWDVNHPGWLSLLL